MRAAKASFVRIAIVLSVVWMAGLAAADDAGPYQMPAELGLSLSHSEMNIGDTLIINITCNTTDPYSYNRATVMVSNRDTGNVFMYVQQNLTSDLNLTQVYLGVQYTLNTSTFFTASKAVPFGTYAVWVTVNNVSAFSTFKVIPSIEDLYNDINKIQMDNAEADANYWWTIKVIFPSSIIMCAAVMLFAYVQWRIPGNDKEDVKNWLLSKLDGRKIDKLVGDVRDINRYGFSTRAAPSVQKNDTSIKVLLRKRRLLKSLAESIDDRAMKMKTRLEDAQEFKDALVDTMTAIDEEVASRNDEIEKSLRSIEAETNQMNRKNLPPPERKQRTRVDFERIRDLLESRGDNK